MDLEIVDALRAVGVPDDKARAVVVSLHREIDQRYALHATQLVTRGDLVEAVARLETKMAETTGRLDMKLAETKAEVSRTRAEVIDTKAELIKWFVGSVIAMAGVFTAIFRLIPH